MATVSASNLTVERLVRVTSGWTMLFMHLILFIAAVLSLGFGIYAAAHMQGALAAVRIPAGVILLLLALLCAFGYFTLQPNEARVLILFGRYKGTVRESGFHWANPFYARARGRVPAQAGASIPAGQGLGARLRRVQAMQGYQPLSTKISLRAHNFNSDTLKVNDKRGNPVEIGAVIVWRVQNTAQAAFDVEDYSAFVEAQSESAIRSIASRYAYDHGEAHELTLRGGADEIAVALKQELRERLAKAGIEIEEARLTHLAYAPEIAPAMLRRQQAEAIVAARQIIVHNAVSMVHMALDELDQKNVVKLDDERRAAMVSNLLVVLCGSSEPSPVINTGTLYT